MKILIHESAAQHYINRCYRHARGDYGQLHRPEFAKMLEAIEGKWIEVETAHLFRDQFNTVPIPGVSEQGMRIMIEDVAEIQDDARIGVVKCAWCYGYEDPISGVCLKCGKTEYLRPLNPCFPGGVAPKENP